MTSTQARIAVLMPAYNPGTDIVETLDSLRKQTVPFKLFIIDDGSMNKPDYPSLLQGINHDLTLSPRNLGVMEARNPALRKILAEDFTKIALIDCGDLAYPDRLQTQSEYLDNNPQISIVGSHVELNVLDSDTGVTHSNILLFPLTNEACRSLLWSNMPVSHPAVMLRREVFDRIGIYSTEYAAAEDFDLVWRANAAGFNICNVDKVLLLKKENAKSISVQKRKTQVLSRLRILWAHRQINSPASLNGLLRTFLLFAAPQGLVKLLKRQLK
jgi:glycosyltransferase involved in cell wall biosynthesis